MFSARAFVNKFRTAASSFTSKRNMSFNPRNLMARENVPYLGGFVGCCALAFQVGVLHPFHTVLSDQFADIQVLLS